MIWSISHVNVVWISPLRLQLVSSVVRDKKCQWHKGKGIERTEMANRFLSFQKVGVAQNTGPFLIAAIRGDLLPKTFRLCGTVVIPSLCLETKWLKIVIMHFRIRHAWLGRYKCKLTTLQYLYRGTEWEVSKIWNYKNTASISPLVGDTLSLWWKASAKSWKNISNNLTFFPYY